MKRFAFAWILVLSIFILVPFNIPAQTVTSQDKQMIEDINKEMEKYMVNGDYKGALKYYTDDAISLPSYQQMLKGKEAIEKQSAEDQQSGMKITSFNMETSDVFGSGNLLYEVGTYTITVKGPQMKEPQNDHGKYLTVFEKGDDGSLKIKAETWNTDMNPWMQMQQGGENMMNEEKK